MSEKIEEKIPLLYVDVKLDSETSDRITIYNGDDPLDLADRFAKKNCIS